MTNHNAPLSPFSRAKLFLDISVVFNFLCEAEKVYNESKGDDDAVPHVPELPFFFREKPN